MLNCERVKIITAYHHILSPRDNKGYHRAGLVESPSGDSRGDNKLYHRPVTDCHHSGRDIYSHRVVTIR